jgi:threonylcarbamoyladenosine tRNA methylthiotransferase MtaB
MNKKEDKKKKFKVVALGCRTNQYEAQAFRDGLKYLGYERAQDGEEADLAIVNTCTVTEGADSSSRHEIRDLARKNPACQIIVTGCLAEREAEMLKKLPLVRHVVPCSEKEKLLALVAEGEALPEFRIYSFDGHSRAFVKVQDGCNSFCSYCIIPYVRGFSRSRSIVSIEKECRDLVEAGFKEIVITGINVGDFQDSNRGLADLLGSLEKIPRLDRIRISSIDPNDITPHLEETLFSSDKVCHSFHLCLQSGSNAILRRMCRKYSLELYFEIVERFRARDPLVTFTTDVIVGFPGEKEQEFEETLEVIKKVQFAKVHIFPYSDRPGTRASNFKDKIPHAVITKRKTLISDAAEKAAFLLREKYVGNKEKILLEETSKDPNFLMGHTRTFLPVQVERKNFRPSMLLDVELIENTEEFLRGIPC